MLDTEVTRLFNELLDTGLREHRLQLRWSIATIKERSPSHSTATLLRISELLRLELKYRGSMAWDKLQEVMSNLGFDPDLPVVENVKQLLGTAIDGQYSELVTVLNEETVKMKLSRSYDLENERDNVKRELNARVDLLSSRLQRQRPMGSHGQVFNFYGSIGAFQTGSYSNVNISLNLSPQAVGRLRQAIDNTRIAVLAAGELPSEQKAEIVAVIDDITKELSIAEPNKLRVKHLIQGVLLAIQASGSMAGVSHELGVSLASTGL